MAWLHSCQHIIEIPHEKHCTLEVSPPERGIIRDRETLITVIPLVSTLVYI